MCLYFTFVVAFNLVMIAHHDFAAASNIARTTDRGMKEQVFWAVGVGWVAATVLVILAVWSLVRAKCSKKSIIPKDDHSSDSEQQ